MIERQEFFDFYEAYQEDERRKAARDTPGGSFWNNQNVRIGKRYGSLVVTAAKEGRLLYRDAFQLLDMSGKTFDNYARNLGISFHWHPSF